MEPLYLSLIGAAVDRCKAELTAVLHSGELAAYHYQKAHTKEAGTFDAHYSARARLVQGILFSPELPPERLEPVLRELLLEELLDRESNSFQGYGPPLEILTALLNTYQRAEDAVLFERAKNANFDCACGFSLGEPVYPRTLEDYDLLDCIYLAEDLYDKEASSALTDLWIAQQVQWTANSLHTYAFLEKQRGNLQGQLAAQQALLALLRTTATDWDFCSAATRCMEIQLALERYEDAFATLKEAMPRLESCHKKWYGLGLGRCVLECCMDLILVQPSSEMAHAIWQWAHPYVILTKNNMQWNLYRKAAEVALKKNDYPLSQKLTRRLNTEQQKLHRKR